ncbi:MAG TPA: nucleotidyltransferase domain-containing protein [Gemmatimonadaceae bacterium]|nr:nucleotidyltransferase domain-containing protein [Gemmatimonadaceae bacterium]
MPATPPSIEQLQEAAAAVARAAGYRLVVLFGSTARGEPSPRDVDLGIETGDGSHVLDPVDAAARFTTALGGGRIDAVDLRRANPVLLMAVARDGIPLYEASGVEFANFWSLAMRRYADTKKFRDAVREDLREFVRSRSGGES